MILREAAQLGPRLLRGQPAVCVHVDRLLVLVGPELVGPASPEAVGVEAAVLARYDQLARPISAAALWTFSG